MTSEIDLTGQARKMGRNAGLKNDGTLDSVHSVSGTELQEGSILARTTQPDVPDSKGLGDTERAKYKKTGKTYYVRQISYFLRLTGFLFVFDQYKWF